MRLMVLPATAAALGWAGLALAGELLDPAAAVPPVAATHETVVETHGDRLVDPYAWLKDESDPAVTAYLEAENVYADAVLAPLAPLEETLFAEITARLGDSQDTLPIRYGDWLYWERIRPGEQHWEVMRQPVAPYPTYPPHEETILETNELAAAEDYFEVGNWQVTRDGRFLAFQADYTGGLDFRLTMVDMATGAQHGEEIADIDGFDWSPDDRTLFYVAVDPETLRAFAVRRLALQTGVDTLVYEEPDEEFSVEVYTTADRRFMVINSYSSDTSETRLLDPYDAAAEPQLVAERRSGIVYSVNHGAGRLYIRTNDVGPTFRIATATVAEPDDWHDLVPARADVELSGFALFARHLVVEQRRGGRPELSVVDLATGESEAVTFPEPSYSAYLDWNPHYDADSFLYNYESAITPPSIFAYHLNRQQSELAWQEPVGGGYTADAYVTERIFATAPDGTAIPISLAYRRGVARDGTAPLLLEAYGAYGDSYDPWFDQAVVTLLDRGVIYAFAHARGGGEYGLGWYEAGRLGAKMNTFTDVIAAAEHLIAERYTQPSRMVATGTSAGGLTMGVVVNLRPDLFRAAVLNVPFVDVLTAMLDEDLPLTTVEYSEWGDPNVAEEYAWMRAYDPYVNLAAKPYPDVLVVGGLTDSQVPFWQPAKYVARLRAMTGGRSLILLRTDLDAGHGGDPGRYDEWRRWAQQYAFVLGVLGITE